MRVLFLSSWFPWPPSNGAKLRAHNLLHALAPAHEVSLISFSHQPDVDAQCVAARELCTDVHVVRRRPFYPRSARALAGLLSPTPRSLVATFSPEMAGAIAGARQANSYDLIIAAALETARYAPTFGRTPALYEEVELAVLRDRLRHPTSSLRGLRHSLTWSKHARYLRHLLPSFRACTVVSEPEMRLLRAAAPDFAAIEVVPNFVDLQRYRGIPATPRPDRMIFCGSLTYDANHDAMRWFLQEVYPLIRRRAPNARLIITGDPGETTIPAAQEVELTGHVKDVRPWLAGAWLSICPLRVGGGTRLKILESLALGTPVVATSKGAEGLDLEPHRHALIADDPPGFADAVVRLLGDPALREHLSREGVELIRQRYDARIVGARFRELVERVARPDGRDERGHG